MSKGITNYFEVYGKIMWAKVFEQNRDKHGFKGAYDNTDGACTVNMILDDENLDKLRQAGTGKNLDNPKNKTPDGYNVKLVRRFKNDDFPSLGGAPKVAHPDGSPWDLEMDGSIGNFSTGVAYGHVYTPNDGSPSTTRLDGLQVIDHVPYESSGGLQFKDYSKKPDTSKTSTSSGDHNDYDDEIPF